MAAKGLDKIEPLLERIAADESVPALATRDVRRRSARITPSWRPGSPSIDKQAAGLASRQRVEPATDGSADDRPDRRLPVAHQDRRSPHAFRSGSRCAAWLGLTAKDHSSGGKQKLGGITRAGDESLRAVLVCGATAYIAHVSRRRTQPSPWLAELLKRKPPKLAAVALANKTARIAWKLMISGQHYDRTRTAAPLAAAA